MNFKHIFAATMLAGCAIGVSAKAVTVTSTSSVGTVKSIGAVDPDTDYLPGALGTVTWTVPTRTVVTTGTGANKVTTTTTYADAFTDVYNFTVANTETVTASVQAGSATNYTLNTDTTELLLYSGTYVAGTSLSTYTLIDQIAYTTAQSDLVALLTTGSYFYVVEGTTTGAKGGKYTLEVTATVPEPANAALLLAGLGIFGLVAKRRKLV